MHYYADDHVFAALGSDGMAIGNVYASDVIDMMDDQGVDMSVAFGFPWRTPDTMTQIYETMARFPDNTIVLAHWGGGVFFYNLLKKAVKETLKNVYYDTAASPFL